MLAHIRKAFTLIELLIVVAIIAILAAIAVPNFLEAQTRAKVVQSIADKRNTATALAAYRVDNNGALPAIANNYAWAERYEYYRRLSTPISYMTRVPEDLFFKQWNIYGTSYYYRAAVWDNNIMKSLMGGNTAPGVWSDVLPLSSEMRNLFIVYFRPMFTLWGKDGAHFVITGLGPAWHAQTYFIPYDPTNGTISAGQIYFYGD